MRRTIILFVLISINGCGTSPRTPETDPIPINRVVTSDGLVIEDVVVGTGRSCLSPDAVVVLRWRMDDGSLSDAVRISLSRADRVLRSGVPGMRVGGERRLSEASGEGQVVKLIAVE